MRENQRKKKERDGDRRKQDIDGETRRKKETERFKRDGRQQERVRDT